MWRAGSGCGRGHVLWTAEGQQSAPRAQLAALDPPLPDEEGEAGEGVDEDDELGDDEPSFDDDDDDEDDEPSFDDDDDDEEALSDAVALARLSVR